MLICIIWPQLILPVWDHGSYRNLWMKFNDFSMTFQGPFKAVMAGIILEKSYEVHQDFTSFLWTTSYTFYYDQFMNKTNVEGLQIFAYFLIATYSKIVAKRRMIIIYEKYPTSLNWYFAMTFTDFQWLSRQNVIFLGQHEIPWLFQACMNHVSHY